MPTAANPHGLQIGRVYLDERNAILQADVVLNAGVNQNTIWSVFAKRGMGWFAGTLDGDDTRPVADFSLPPKPNAAKGQLSGVVSDADTAAKIPGAIVAFGGHDRGAGDYVATSGPNGAYAIFDIFTGTYPKVSARGPGFDSVVLDALTVRAGSNVHDFALRRDFASAAGGGSIAAFNGPDFTGFGCGPINAIDQSQGAGWGSDTDHDSLITGLASDKFIVVKLPVKVNVMSMKVHPPKPLSFPAPQWTATPVSSSGAVPQSAGPVQAAFGFGSLGTCGFSIPGRRYLCFTARGAPRGRRAPGREPPASRAGWRKGSR